ncbi:unnamed protein product, partial [Rotaria sordida]
STSEMALQIMGRYSNPPPSEIPTTADFRNTIMAIVGNCGISLQSDVVS